MADSSPALTRLEQVCGSFFGILNELPVFFIWIKLGISLLILQAFDVLLQNGNQFFSGHLNKLDVRTRSLPDEIGEFLNSCFVACLDSF